MSSFLIKPEDILEEFAIDSPEEIDLEAIAEYYGATVVYESLDGFEAKIAGNDKVALITINSNSFPRRQRFSIAHELGHWFYDRGKLLNCNSQSLRSWKLSNPETRANDFAARLILPTKMAKPLISAISSLKFSEIVKIADLFNVGRMATAIRVVKLIDRPAVVAYYKEGRYKWHIPNGHVPELYLHNTLDSSTVASRVLKDKFEQLGSGEEVDADAWFTRSNAGEYTVFEDAIKVQGGVLSVITWTNEQMLTDLLEEEDDNEEDDIRDKFGRKW